MVNKTEQRQQTKQANAHKEKEAKKTIKAIKDKRQIDMMGTISSQGKRSQIEHNKEGKAVLSNINTDHEDTF